MNNFRGEISDISAETMCDTAPLLNTKNRVVQCFKARRGIPVCEMRMSWCSEWQGARNIASGSSKGYHSAMLRGSEVLQASECVEQ